MSASSVVCISHCIAILMSSAGRFLECRNCLRRVQFPAEAQYELIAKQFESHSCSFNFRQIAKANEVSFELEAIDPLSVVPAENPQPRL